MFVEVLDVLLGCRERAEESLRGGVQLQVEELLHLVLGGLVLGDVDLTVITGK